MTVMVQLRTDNDCQKALIKNAQDKKLIDKDNSKEERPELFIVLNRLKLLALLPAEFIESVYEKIEKECLNDFGDYFRDYLNYYKKQWLKQEGAEQISVYKLRNRTNNFLESYHKQLNTFISKKPKHNVFVGLLIVSLEPTHHTKTSHTWIDICAVNLFLLPGDNHQSHFCLGRSNRWLWSHGLTSVNIAGKYEGREQKQETVTRNAAIEEFWRKIEGISEDINGDKRFQELLRIIDQMPEIESLKQKEGEKIEQLIKNIKERDEGIVKYDRLGLIQIRKNSNYNDMLEDLKFYRRRCFATDEKIVFRVEHIE
ncbi:uncharacterized protein LOC141526568 [Cotesia typhae]|uniref:uncharacterized protein LOC141526568 n=1 Tax=Cotesia typhae TaxID=2053667 RepID=UPI003D68A9AA